MKEFLIYQLEGQLYAVPILDVIRVLRVVATLPVAKSSPHLMGMLDLYGTLIPVINLRSLLKLPQKDVELTDIMLVCHMGEASCTLLVDHVKTTAFCEVVTPMQVPQIPLPEALEYYIRWEEETLPVYELKKLISQIEMQTSLSP